MRPGSFVTIKSIESIKSFYSGTICSMPGKLKEVLQSQQISLMVFGETFLALGSSQSHVMILT